MIWFTLHQISWRSWSYFSWLSFQNSVLNAWNGRKWCAGLNSHFFPLFLRQHLQRYPFCWAFALSSLSAFSASFTFWVLAISTSSESLFSTLGCFRGLALPPCLYDMAETWAWPKVKIIMRGCSCTAIDGSIHWYTTVAYYFISVHSLDIISFPPRFHD